MKRLIAVSAVIVCGALASAATAFASTIYNNVQSPVPGNVASFGFEATQTSEIGNRVNFAGTDRQLQSVTVLMSSWGCQTGHWTSGDCFSAPGSTFMHPLTLNIYAVGPGNSPGAVLETKTTTFAMPYRPSADPLNCPSDPGKWFDAGTATCFNGKAFTVTFNLAADNVTLPSQAIISVSYNTSGFGYSPLGYSNPCNSTAAGCPYDSLNLGANDAGPSVGTDADPDEGYAYAAYPGDYCDGSTPVNVFRRDTGWLTNPGCAGFKPAFKVQATTPARTAKTTVRDQVQAAASAPGTSKQDRDRLTDAAKKLTDSLDPSLWIDDGHLKAKGGDKVFDLEKAAVQKLQEIQKDKKSHLDDGGMVQAWIDALVAADRSLAQTAFDESFATPGADMKKLTEAAKELAKGDADAANKSADAIEHYENAWKKAQEAIKKL